jgi:large subunit ribosomal protein L9
MKVILITRIAKLGTIGDIVNVKDGYARNFLIPQKKAIFYSAANYKVFESQKQDFEAQSQKLSEAAQTHKDKFNGKNIIIVENASDDGRLYGSVSTSTIADKANEIIGSKEISRLNILLKKPIKELGVYNVKIDLYSTVEVDIKVVVTRNESEVDILLDAYNKEAESRKASVNPEPKKAKVKEKAKIEEESKEASA